METYGYLIIGVFLPPVVSLLKSQRWSYNVKFLLSLGLSFVATAVAMAIDGALKLNDPASLVQNASVVWAASQGVYNLYFGSTNTNELLETTLVK